MKKLIALTLAALLSVSLLTACGSTTTEPTPQEPVDLTAFYDELATEYGWDDFSMATVEGEMLELTYPGLEALTTNQVIAKMPMMTATVSELVLLECADEEGAMAAESLLQERLDVQAQGGAWYPESMEAWGRGEVIRQGNYVAMIAVDGYQDEIATKFEALFQ